MNPPLPKPSPSGRGLGEGGSAGTTLSRRERVIFAGIGWRRSCSAKEIVALVRRACAEAGCVPSALAAPAFKRDEAILAAAAVLGLDLVLIEDASLAAAQAECATQSAVALRAVGVGSVAEGSALAAAGVGGRLLLKRIASERATCALAEGP